MNNEQLTMSEKWVHKKLGEVCTIHGRIGFRGYTTDDLVEKGYGAITFSPSDIHDSKLCYDNCDYISWFKYEESPEIKVFNGDILFCKTASIGKCAIVEDLKEKATINPQFVVLKDFTCDSKYLYYKLISYDFQTHVLGITGGSTIKTMSQEKLGLEPISFPALPDGSPDLSAQRRIAAILSSADRVIASTRKVIAKYKQMKQGLMEDLLKPKEGWKMVRLGEVGDIVTGLTYSPSNVRQEGVLVLRSSNIQDDNLCFEDNVYVDVESFNPVIENDILICVRNGSRALIGKTARITKEVEGCAFGAFMLVYRSSYNDFLYHFFKSDMFFSQVSRNIGATINSINGSDLKNMEVYMPSDFAEQRRIAAILSGIDAKIAAEEKVLEKYEKVKKGLMERLLNEKNDE